MTTTLTDKGQQMLKPHPVVNRLGELLRDLGHYADYEAGLNDQYKCTCGYNEPVHPDGFAVSGLHHLLDITTTVPDDDPSLPDPDWPEPDDPQ